mmetsp:Transcript_19626/g.45782  ORF Transcript_19626/g.45782 Transcript_19626/m.45782 type:complete len:709 (+) Transcript_19626:171-2297(+)
MAPREATGTFPDQYLTFDYEAANMGMQMPPHEPFPVATAVDAAQNDFENTAGGAGAQDNSNALSAGGFNATNAASDGVGGSQNTTNLQSQTSTPEEAIDPLSIDPTMNQEQPRWESDNLNVSNTSTMSRVPHLPQMDHTSVMSRVSGASTLAVRGLSQGFQHQTLQPLTQQQQHGETVQTVTSNLAASTSPLSFGSVNDAAGSIQLETSFSTAGDAGGPISSSLSSPVLYPGSSHTQGDSNSNANANNHLGLPRRVSTGGPRRVISGANTSGLSFALSSGARRVSSNSIASQALAAAAAASSVVLPVPSAIVVLVAAAVSSTTWWMSIVAPPTPAASTTAAAVAAAAAASAELRWWWWSAAAGSEPAAIGSRTGSFAPGTSASMAGVCAAGAAAIGVASVFTGTCSSWDGRSSSRRSIRPSAPSTTTPVCGGSSPASPLFSASAPPAPVKTRGSATISIGSGGGIRAFCSAAVGSWKISGWSLIFQCPWATKSKFRWRARLCIRAYFSRTLTWIPSSFATVIQLTRWLCSLAIALYLAHRFWEWVTIRFRSEAVDTTMADRCRFFGTAAAKTTAFARLAAFLDDVSGSCPSGVFNRFRKAPALVISIGTRFEATRSAARRSAASFCCWAKFSRCCRCMSLRIRFSSRAFSRASFSACFCFWTNSRSRCLASFLFWEMRFCSRLAFALRSCSSARSADLACCWALERRA